MFFFTRAESRRFVVKRFAKIMQKARAKRCSSAERGGDRSAASAAHAER
jgi:hypothetical protein